MLPGMIFAQCRAAKWKDERRKMERLERNGEILHRKSDTRLDRSPWRSLENQDLFSGTLEKIRLSQAFSRFHVSAISQRAAPDRADRAEGTFAPSDRIHSKEK